MKKFEINGQVVYAKSLHDVISHLKDRIDPDEEAIAIDFKERKTDAECKELAKKFNVRFIMNAWRNTAKFMGDKRDLDKLIDFVKPETVKVDRYQVVIDDSKVNDDDVIYVADPLRMGGTVKEFTNVDAVYKFQQKPESVGYHVYILPKSEYKSLKKMRNAEFAFNRLFQERKAKSFDSIVKDEENVIYEVATAKVKGGRMDHEYFESKEELLKKYRGKDNGSVVKLDGFLGPFYNGMKNGKKVWRYEDKNSYYDSRTKDAEYIKVGGKQVEVLETLPNGWRVDRDATTAPRGYVWINNNKSRFGGERKSALIREELVQNINDAEILSKKEREKYIAEMAKALYNDFGYSREEANDIAIKRANALGEDWRVRWDGDIMKQVKQELKHTARKTEDSIHDSVFESLWHKAKEDVDDYEELETLFEELDRLYTRDPNNPYFKKYVREATNYATNLANLSSEILRHLKPFSKI